MEVLTLDAAEVMILHEEGREDIKDVQRGMIEISQNQIFNRTILREAQEYRDQSRRAASAPIVDD